MALAALLCGAACSPEASSGLAAGSGRGRAGTVAAASVTTVVPCIDQFDRVKPGCTVASTQLDATTTQYTVTQPIVNQPNADYPMIRLLPGDRVWVTAQGCVQTGGGGLTWKDYVLPFPFESGPQGRYHGTVTVPGNLTRAIYELAEQQPPQPLVVPDFPSSDSICTSSESLHLQLGYTDDNWGDNGYSDHDDGDARQCASNSVFPFANHGQPATVVVTVQHGVADAFYSPAPLDLVPSCVDDNYLLSNARWGWQQTGPDTSFTLAAAGFPATTQATSGDGPSFFKDLFFSGVLSFLFPPLVIVPLIEAKTGRLCDVDVIVPASPEGHRNWSDVTYSGRLQWASHDSPLTGDDDYNIHLWTNRVGPEAAAEGGLRDGGAYHFINMEFDSDETIDEWTDVFSLLRRERSLTWWDDFKNAVDHGDPSAGAAIDGHFAIATGLMGLDEVHVSQRAGNELHPVHALAIQVADGDEIVDATHIRRKWAVFVRNSGNEGECSSLDHYLDVTRYTFRLPPRISSELFGALNVDATRVETNIVGPSDGAPRPTYDMSRDPAHPDLLLTVPLPDPDVRSWRAGDVTVTYELNQPVDPSLLCPLTLDPEFIFDDTLLPPGVPFGDEAGCGAGLGPAIASRRTLHSRANRSAEADADGDRSPEAITAAVWAALTPEQQGQAIATFQALMPAREDRRVKTVPVSPATFEPPAPEVPATEIGPPSVRFMLRESAKLRAICAATSGNLPVLPDGLCASAPPFTELRTSGATAGNDGWSVTPVTVTLVPHDSSGGGIASVQYSRDGSTWLPYAGPFVAGEGIVTVYYRSTDMQGNVEPTNDVVIMTDSRPPQSQVTASMSGGQLALAYAVSDPVPGSGAQSFHLVPMGRVSPIAAVVAPAPSGELRLPTQCRDFEYWATDAAGNDEAPHQRSVDATPPALSVSPGSLCMWPPDHGRVIFRLGSDVAATATDDCDPAPSVRIAGVTSSEADNGLGDGDTANDVSYSDHAFCVRRERAGTGSGRTYTVAVEAKDESGNTTTQQILVEVPHQQLPGCDAVGQPIAETAPCE
jgi:hypothetical protein